MQLLDIDTIKQQLTMPMAIEAIETLLRVQAKNSDWVKSPERIVIPTYSASDVNTTGSHLSMPSVVFDGEHEYAVVKLVTICPDNPKRNKPTTMATISVINNSTGETLAFMDGVYVTQVRTAALSGIATKYMAKADSEVVAVVGTGGMAYEQLNAVLTVCPDIKQVRLWNRTRKTAEVFQDKFIQEYPRWQVNFTVCDALDEAISDADIINLATRATKGLFEISQVKDGVHINAVGAYQPEMKEVSDSVIEAATYVVIDDAEGGLHEAGDLIQADRANNCAWTWQELSGNLADLVSNNLVIDKKLNKGITLFKSVGAASFDAAVALELAKTAQQEGLGQTFEL